MLIDIKQFGKTTELDHWQFYWHILYCFVASHSTVIQDQESFVVVVFTFMYMYSVCICITNTKIFSDTRCRRQCYCTKNASTTHTHTEAMHQHIQRKQLIAGSVLLFQQYNRALSIVEQYARCHTLLCVCVCCLQCLKDGIGSMCHWVDVRNEHSPISIYALNLGWE